MKARRAYALDSEAALLAQVRDLARRCHWRTYHTLRATGSEKGFPDLVMLRTTEQVVECLIVELKAERGVLTTEQAAWLADFARVASVETHVWYPRDWVTIVERLTRRLVHVLDAGGQNDERGAGRLS